jgi:hypothetical protein
MGGIDETPEAILARRQIAPLENAVDFRPREKLRGDRRVAANSEEALILFRRHRREQFALARRQRARRPHHALREPEQVLGSFGVVGEEMAQVRLAIRLRRRVLQMADEHARESLREHAFVKPTV